MSKVNLRNGEWTIFNPIYEKTLRKVHQGIRSKTTLSRIEEKKELGVFTKFKRLPDCLDIHHLAAYISSLWLDGSA
ncbi:MAG: hypothetical protein ACUVV5_03825 [Candidatus Aminicenantales bacterium]